MRLQHHADAVVQTNDFEMCLDAFKSYCVQVLEQIESKHPGLKEMLLPFDYLFKHKRHTQCELQSANGVNKL